MIRRLAAIAALAVLGFAPLSASAETTLRIDETGIGDLDPHRANDVADAMLAYNVYDTLVFPSLDGKTSEMKPHLAEKIDIQGLVYTITLRPNVKFHSGNILSADDVVFSMKRMTALNTGFSYLFTGWIDTIEAKDPRTVVVKLTKPYSSFYLSLSRLAIVDSKTVIAKKEAGNFGELGDYGQKFLNTNGAGTGAYRVESHKPDELTVMRKFDGYFLPIAKTAPDIVRMPYGIKEPALLALVQRGEHDIVNTFTSPETKRAMSQIKGVTHLLEPGIAMFFVKMNTSRAPVDDVHCRKALAFAVDYESLHGIENIGDTVKGAKSARGPLLETMGGYDPAAPEYAKRDMAKARAELAQCKHKPADHTLQITWIAEVAKEERIALLLQQNWGELGFKTEVVRLPWTLFTQQVAKAETGPMFVQIYTFSRTPDPDSWLYNIYHSSRHGQTSAAEFLKDAEVDKLLDEGRGMANGPARDALYKKAAARITDLQPSIFGYQVVNTYPKRDSVVVPTLENPKMNTGLMGGNFIFRIIEMKS